MSLAITFAILSCAPEEGNRKGAALDATCIHFVQLKLGLKKKPGPRRLLHAAVGGGDMLNEPRVRSRLLLQYLLLLLVSVRRGLGCWGIAGKSLISYRCADSIYNIQVAWTCLGVADFGSMLTVAWKRINNGGLVVTASSTKQCSLY
jgi:hypothetical protein